MKILQKIGLILLLIAICFLGVHRASAATLPQNFSSDPNTLFNQTFTFNKNSQITVTIVDSAAPNQPHYPLTFVQSNSNKLEYDSTQQLFCASNVAKVASPAKITLSAPPSGTAFHGNLLAYVEVNGGNCKQFTNNPVTIQNNNTNSGGTGGLLSKLTYNGKTYTQIANTALYGLSTQISPDCYGGSVIVSDTSGTSGTAYFGLQYNPSGGLTSLTSVLNSAGTLNNGIANNTNGCGFPGSVSTSGYEGTITNGVLNAGTPGSLLGTDCTSAGPGANQGGYTCVCGSQGCAWEAAATTSSSTSCESNFNSPLGWIICPAFSLADDAATGYSSFINDQLCFKTTDQATSTTGSSLVCQGNNNLDNSVYNAWSIFKNIASALLVVILLVMVISQAIGGGPFDAYTVRKVLPKVVAAIILMQFSWWLIKFAIDLSNDVGGSIANLLQAPFGGADNLKLQVLVGNAFGQHSGWTNTGIGISFVALAGWAALSASIPGLILLALYVVLAVLTAFVVLVLRKLLIITLVILTPLAIILWILPGTERYWKMWSDNLIKLLAMYPLIMMFIAGGRIFAKITSNNTSGSLIHPLHLAVVHLGHLPIPYFASVTDFVEIAIIMGAYFAPYFLLPQTFKWGGAALGAVSKGVSQGMEKLGKPGVEYLNWRKGLSRASMSKAIRRQEKERQIRHGYYEDLASSGVRGSINRARLYNVDTIGNNQQVTRRARQHAEAELDKARREETQQATTELMQRLLPQYDPTSQDDVREAIATGKTLRVRRADGQFVDFDGAEYAATHEYGQRAALDRALIHGQMGVIDQYYTEAMASGDQHRITEATRFKDDNAEALGRRLTHVLKGHTVAAQATAAEIAQQSGHEVESIIAHQSQIIARGTRPGATVQEQADARAAYANLTGYITRHRQARANPATASSVDLRGTRAVEAYLGALSGNPASLAVIGEINHGQPHPVTGTLLDPDGRRVDREANRDRYRTPGVPADQTIPEIVI